MRRLSDRARLEGMLALRKAVDGVRRNQSSPSPAGNVDARASYSERRDVDGPTWTRRAELSRETYADVAYEPERAPAADRDLELAKALDRVADSIEHMAAQLDAYHQERTEHLDAIEFLLREMVINTVPPASARSVVLGGVVDSAEMERSELEQDERDQRRLDPDDEITIIPDGFPLDVDTAVEVRSRFHDRWITGFSIAEAVDAPGRCRYRLTRRSDGIPLPILFEACDVRAVSAAYDRKNAPSSRSSLNERQSS